MLVTLDDIYNLSHKALCAHGATVEIASSVAEAIQTAEGYGNKICGLYYLESYCQQLDSGRVQGKIAPLVHQTRPGRIDVDGKFGFAQPAFSAGLNQAVTAAKTQGIALLVIAHTHTCTALGYFTAQIARAGLIGIGTTNASAIVAPPGGSKRILGTNPFAFSVPAENGEIAMQFDFSTAATALGKITMAKAADEEIPLGWAVDPEGKPTTDPAAALQGALVPAADYKGWGLGLMVELLAAGLSGSVNSLDVSGLKLPDGPPHDLGQSYILIDPDAGGAFQACLNRISEAVKAEPSARLPGEQKKLKNNIQIDDTLWSKLQNLTTPSTNPKKKSAPA